MGDIRAEAGSPKAKPPFGITGDGSGAREVQRPRRSRVNDGLAATAPVMAALIGLLAIRPGEAAAADAPSGPDAGPAPPGSIGASGDQGSPGASPIPAGVIGAAAPAGATVAGAILDFLFPTVQAATLTGPPALGAAAGRAAGAEPGTVGSVGTATAGFDGLGAPAIEVAVLQPFGLADESTASGGDAPAPAAAAPIAADIGGTNGNDRITGTDAGETIRGLGGDDVIDGAGGDDSIEGGEGDDTLDGGAGDDLIEGGFGDDALIVRTIDDLAADSTGGAASGTDELIVAPEFGASVRAELDWLVPDGLVTFRLGHILDPIPPGANWYPQQVYPDIENLEIQGTEDFDVLGDARANAVLGGGGGNVILGRGGDDQLAGGAGDDLLDGGDGADMLEGGHGHDVLYGGGGDDVYLLGLAEDSADSVFDHEGVSTLRVGGADPAKLSARLDGADLRIAHDGAQIVVLKDYLGHESAFGSIETGTGSVAVADLSGGSTAAALSVEAFLDVAGAAGFATEHDLMSGGDAELAALAASERAAEREAVLAG